MQLHPLWFLPIQGRRVVVEWTNVVGAWARRRDGRGSSGGGRRDWSVPVGMVAPVGERVTKGRVSWLLGATP